MTTTTASSTDAAHEGDHAAPRYDDVNMPVVILVAVISAIVTFLTIALVQGMCYHWQSAYLKKRELQYESVNLPAKEQIEDQRSQLSGTAEGTISIDAAFQQVMAEYGGDATTGSGTKPATDQDIPSSDLSNEK